MKIKLLGLLAVVFLGFSVAAVSCKKDKVEDKQEEIEDKDKEGGDKGNGGGGQGNDKDDEKCKGVECNAGYCEDGECICPDGYSGKNCEVLWSSNFVGKWDRGAIIKASTTDVTILLLDNYFLEYSEGRLNIPLKMTSDNYFEFPEDYYLGSSGNAILHKGYGKLVAYGSRIEGKYMISQTRYSPGGHSYGDTSVVDFVLERN